MNKFHTIFNFLYTSYTVFNVQSSKFWAYRLLLHLAIFVIFENSGSLQIPYKIHEPIQSSKFKESMLHSPTSVKIHTVFSVQSNRCCIYKWARCSQYSVLYMGIHTFNGYCIQCWTQSKLFISCSVEHNLCSVQCIKCSLFYTQLTQCLTFKVLGILTSSPFSHLLFYLRIQVLCKMYEYYLQNKIIK